MIGSLCLVAAIAACFSAPLRAQAPHWEMPLVSSLVDGVLPDPRSSVSTLPAGSLALFSNAYYYHCRPEVNTAAYFERDIDGSRQDLLLNIGAVVGAGLGTEVGIAVPFSPGWSNGLGGGLGGYTDCLAFARYGRPAKSGPWPDIGAELQIKLNTGARPDRTDWYGTGYNDLGGRLILVRDLDPVSLFCNLGGKVILGSRELRETSLRNTVNLAAGLSWSGPRLTRWDAGLAFESDNKVDLGTDFLQAYGRARLPLNRRYHLLFQLARGLSPGAPSLTTHIGCGFRPSPRSPAPHPL
ncbi:hypothetical protein ACFLT7_04350 [candidate division KSB1 bacterium]